MSTRPSNKDFFEWANNDQNKSKMQNALRAHPDLAHIKDEVSFNQILFLLIFFIFYFLF